jgi:hypothetical protein
MPGCSRLLGERAGNGGRVLPASALAGFEVQAVAAREVGTAPCRVCLCCAGVLLYFGITRGWLARLLAAAAQQLALAGACGRAARARAAARRRRQRRRARGADSDDSERDPDAVAARSAAAKAERARHGVRYGGAF